MEQYRHVWQGWLDIVCEGGYPEQFINYVTQRGFSLWNIRRIGERLYCSCAAAEYVALKPLARRACVRMRIGAKHGIPFLLKPLRRRNGLLVGLLVFLVVLQGLSSRIWVVEVSGNKRVSEETVLSTLQSLGVYEGARFSKVDLPQLQLEALQQLPELTWLTVNQMGSTAKVEVHEREETPPIEKKEPANVSATHDGVIVEIHAVSGQPAVKVGDAVTKDSLLISGVVDSKVGPLLKRAAGTVKARMEEKLSVEVPFTETVPKKEARVIEETSFYFFGFHVPLFAQVEHEGEYVQSTEKKPLCVYGRKLPIGVSVKRYEFTETETIKRSEKEALQLAKKRLCEEEKKVFAEAVIETTQIQEIRTETGWKLVGKYRLVREIGKTTPL